MTIDQLTQAGAGIAAIALVGWMVRHVITVTIPAMNTQHYQHVQKLTETFERVNREQRSEFRELLEADRQRHQVREEGLRQDFRDAIDRQVSQCGSRNKAG